MTESLSTGRSEFDTVKPYMDKRSELFAALAKAQGEIGGAKKDTANPFHKSKYADLASVWEAIREPFSKNGLSIVQEPFDGPEGCVGLRTTLGHTSGAQMTSAFTQKLKDATNPQVVGSALTYMRRYALMAVAGVAPVDDDGNEASVTGAPKPQAPGVTIKREYQTKESK